MEKLKILVVDDESRMRKLVRDFLVRQDYEVLEAGDGEEALDIFYREKDIALLILDAVSYTHLLTGKRIINDIYIICIRSGLT